ncbi:MAG TPA: hypothetical protein PLI62_07130 [Spirochaetota bacterium]|nr:hypothetical protein [Spirochaetota bacterium]
MKKILITGILIILSTTALSAFTIQRRQWWEQRLEDLASQRSKLDNPASPIIPLIDRETSRGKKILALYTRTDRGTAPPETTESAAAAQGTAAIVTRTLKPLIAAHLLKELTGETVSRSRPESVRKTLREEVAALLGSEGNFSDETLLQEIVNIDISRAEWDSLYADFFMTKLMLKKKDISSAFSKNITDSAVDKFALTGNPSAENDIVLFTSDTFSAGIGGFSDQSQTDSRMLRETWSWADISSRIKNDCFHYKKIINLLHKTEGNIPFPKLRYYLRNIPSLDTIYFTGIAKLALPPGGAPSGSRSLDTVIGKIDQLRRKAGPGLNGRESDEYFNRLRTRFDSLIARYSPEAGPSPVVEDYRDRSISFLTWVSSTRRRDSKELTGIYEKKISRTTEYADFIGTLFQEAADIPPAAGRQEHLYFKAALQHSPKFFSYIESGLAIPAFYNKNMSPGDTHALRTRFRKYISYRTTVQRNIRESSNEYRQHILEKKHAKKSDRGKKNELLGRYEVELMTATLHDYVAAYKSLKYGKSALTMYARTYQKLIKEVEGGMTPVVKKCIDRNSLFSAVPSVRTEKITDEHQTKIHLRREIRSLISRIAHLESFYDRYNINVHNILDRGEAIAIETLISKQTAIPAGDWSLNEENFPDIDRKLAQSLSNARKKAIWNTTADRVHPVQLPGTDIALSIPDGWTRNDGHSRKSENMTVMTYTATGDTASIDIAIVPAETNTMRTIHSGWLKIQRAASVKTKWGRKNNIDYFWSLARDNNSSIRESYLFQNGNNAVIISGSTTRNRYNFFKKKLDSVFESVRPPRSGR